MFSVDPAITFDNNARFVPAGSLVFPSQSGGDHLAYIGPNFMFTAAPEPGPLALMALAMFTLGFRARRRGH